MLNLKQNQDPFVSDYEIDFNISFFAEKKYAHIPDLEGNSFFDYDLLLFSKTEGKSESEIIQLIDHNHTSRHDLTYLLCYKPRLFAYIRDYFDQ